MDEGEEQRLARAAAQAESAALRLAEAEGRIEELEGRLAALQALCVSLQTRMGASEADEGAGGAAQLGGSTAPDYLGEFDDMAADSQISAAHARSLAFRQDLPGCGGVLELHRFQEATGAEGVFRIKTALPAGATQGDPLELVVESPDGDLNDTSGNWLIAARQAGASSDKTLKWVALTAGGTVDGIEAGLDVDGLSVEFRPPAQGQSADSTGPLQLAGFDARGSAEYRIGLAVDAASKALALQWTSGSPETASKFVMTDEGAGRVTYGALRLETDGQTLGESGSGALLDSISVSSQGLAIVTRHVTFTGGVLAGVSSTTSTYTFDGGGGSSGEGGYTGVVTVLGGVALSSAGLVFTTTRLTLENGLVTAVAPDEDIVIAVAECEED